MFIDLVSILSKVYGKGDSICQMQYYLVMLLDSCLNGV